MGSEQDKLNQTLTLQDGRKLGYAEFGDPKGKPIFYCHGYVGGRLEPSPFIPSDKEYKFRLISIDRPGMGLSSYKDNREILDWPDDVIELADALGIDKFGIVGISGGGPYVAACAYKIPERITKVGIIAGMGPYEEVKKYMKNPNKTLFALTRRFPGILKFILSRQKKRINYSDPDKIKRKMYDVYIKSGRLPKPDREIFKLPGFFDFFINHMRDIYQQGIRGPYLDGRLYVKPWGFELKDIQKFTPVFLWQGELDVNVPLKIGKYITSQILHCIATYYPEEGHVSLEANHIEEILAILTV